MEQYKNLEVVVIGIKAQIEACLNSLDLHENMPDEGEDLGTSLAKAHELCETILKKAAEDEPKKNSVE